MPSEGLSSKLCSSTSPSTDEAALERTEAPEGERRCFPASFWGEMSPLIQWKREYAISKDMVDDMVTNLFVLGGFVRVLLCFQRKAVLQTQMMSEDYREV